MAKTKDATKDRPLLLRKRTDGKLYLNSPEWPPRHEFSQHWLLSNASSGVVRMSENEIHLTLANASATYTITQRPRELVDGQKTTGYWGKLKEGKVG